jgi:hypothetical protein
MYYYNRLLDTLKKENTIRARFANIINPYSLYYLCDHYYGNEIELEKIPIPDDKHNLLKTRDRKCIRAFDIIHVQVNFISEFCDTILSKLDKPVVLSTGQWRYPQLHIGDLAENILNHPNVVLWISQNPIYVDHPKYIAFPFGILDSNLECYSNILLSENSICKDRNIVHLPLDMYTNSCRSKLPHLEYMYAKDFYAQMAVSKFILSPIGDRDDCYRHYEAIGLGTIPISNLNKALYSQIFGKNMYYCDIDEMVDILKTNHVNTQYTEPNKDLICFEYYLQDIKLKIDTIKRKLLNPS